MSPQGSEADSNRPDGARVDPVVSKEIEIRAADGYPLAATLHGSPEETAGVVVVQGATAVKRRFYGRLAAFLATQGLATLTFDYRGVGGSLTGPIRTLEADMMDWARLDAPAARAEGARLADGRPLFVLAHSFGGQALAIEPPDEPLDGAVLVACQEGDLRLWPLQRRPWFLFGVGFTIPVCVRLFGYVPSWAGFGEALPGGVAAQWARWCRTRGYVFGAHPEVAEHGAALGCPLLVLGWTDDHYAPDRAIRALASRFPNAPVDLRYRHPAAHGLRSVGHFGFFRSARAQLWREPAAWLLGRCSPETL